MLAALESQTHFSFHEFTAFPTVHFRMHSVQQCFSGQFTDSHPGGDKLQRPQFLSEYCKAKVIILN